MSMQRPHEISQDVVMQAYRCIKENNGTAGIDKQTIQDFEKNLEGNLYKIWNRMSSGSYFPPPVLRVEIPKHGGGQRTLGIPTVADRIAQQVAKMYLEPVVEKEFHRDSYGYRPGKSAHDALDKARERCWSHNFVIDLDIKGFFDNIDHALLMQAVEHYTQCRWLLIYIKRWLEVPMQCEDGTQIKREKGTPQGGVISPLLANIFLHVVFDKWMTNHHEHVKFERYADDILIHCSTEEEALKLRKDIESRLCECKLSANEEKTKIVYCKDGKRQKTYIYEKFDFLGYEFRARTARNRQNGNLFVGFNPAVSRASRKAMNQTIRSWRLHRCIGMDIEDIAKKVNPVILGWINYYSRYNKTEMRHTYRHINLKLGQWVKRKFTKMRSHRLRSVCWIKKVALQKPTLFAHWRHCYMVKSAVG